MKQISRLHSIARILVSALASTLCWAQGRVNAAIVQFEGGGTPQTNPEYTGQLFGNKVAVGVFQSSYDPILPGGFANICRDFALDDVCNMSPGTADRIAGSAFNFLVATRTRGDGSFSWSFPGFGFGGRQLWIVLWDGPGGTDPVFATAVNNPNWKWSDSIGAINHLRLSDVNDVLFGSLTDGRVGGWGSLPIPEPTSLQLMIAGIGCAWLLRRRPPSKGDRRAHDNKVATKS